MKNYLLILFSIFILSGCDNSESKPDCSLMLCDYVAKSIKLKYVDKTTDKPLFFQGSPNTLEDLKVTSTINSAYIPMVQQDSSDPTVIILTPLIGGEILTLGNLPADKITLKTRSLGEGCCAGSEISSLKINDETICAPCTNETIAVIRK